jgi:hypothetical protein
MLPAFDVLRSELRLVIEDKRRQGHVVDGLDEQLDAMPDRYDAMAEFAERLAGLPLRDDWPYVEPDAIEEIRAECDPERPADPIAEIDPAEAARRVEAGFLASAAGCILGKPLEFNPTLAEIRTALEALGEWPMNDYVSQAALEKLGRRHGSADACCRGNIRFVAPDDDLNYSILGMLVLEAHGVGFTRDQLRALWLRHLPIGTTFGPERRLLLKAGIHSLFRPKGAQPPADLHGWVTRLNAMDEWCGALIRADAYGFACPGRPALAAELAWRDAGWTHRRTGVYGAMLVAAAIACAAVMDDRLAVFETALRYVPQRSRFRERTARHLEQVRGAGDWLEAYEAIHADYGEATHCRIYQEVGTLMNTLRFAADVGDGICKQVSQGNDTDSFGCTSGSLLGAFFGPGHLEPRWLAPFHDEIRTAMAWFYERSLSTLAKRMSKLPALVTGQLAAG